MSGHEVSRCIASDDRTLCAGRDTEAALAELGSHCAAVVICRASPSQKAAIVHMMDEFELRRAGGRGRGFRGWWNRVHYDLKVRFEASVLVLPSRSLSARCVQVADTSVWGCSAQMPAQILLADQQLTFAQDTRTYHLLWLYTDLVHSIICENQRWQMWCNCSRC